jgi:hypothetical protein
MSRKKMTVWGTLDVSFIITFLLGYKIVFVHGLNEIHFMKFWG